MTYQYVVSGRLTKQKIASLVVAVAEARKQIPLDLERFTFFSIHDTWIYHAVFDTKLCALCQAKTVPFTYSGIHLRAIFPWLEIEAENRIGAWVHPNCVKPDTLVHTSKGLTPITEVALGDWILTHKGRYRQVIQLHKNRYEGDLYSINGNLMTGNHPVLTDKGWMNADALNSFRDKVFQPISPMTKTNKPPPVIPEKHSFPFIPSTMLIGVMPVPSVYLDCEFRVRDSEVDVEDVDSVLGNHLYPSFIKRLKEKLLQWRHLSFGLNPLRSLDEKIMRFRTAFHRVVSTLDLVGSLLCRHLTPLQGFGFALGSPLNTCLNQPKVYGASTTVESFSDTIDGLTHIIKFNDFVVRQFNPQLSHLTSTTINNIDNERYKGYVHNLSVYEDESYLIGDRGLVVHNCRCYLQRLTDRTKPLGPLRFKMKRKLKRVRDDASTG